MSAREYDYIRGNTVTKPNRKYEEIDKKIQKENLERRKREQQRRKEEDKKQLVKNILQVAAIALILGVLTIARDAKVYKMQNELSEVKSDIKVTIAEGEALRANLLKYSSISEIKTSATELGMKMPTKDQTISINIEKDYFESIRN